jgi:ring-1,2-phenylacetyl-CoA epoxidase subunit PaaB
MPMPDTQWSRFQVFLQDKPGAPHQDMGSIHAPDEEMALLNARDVFVRRPACVSLWIAPVKSIYSKTAQEIQENGLLTDLTDELPAEKEIYYVFGKAKPAGTQTYLGSVEAGSPTQALKTAVLTFSSGKPVFAWWVISARSVFISDPADVDSLFDPALDKPYRLSTDFHTVSAMRQIKSGKNGPGSRPVEGTPHDS